MSILVNIIRLDGITTWRVRPMREVLRERLWSVGKIEDALAARLWGQ